MHAGVGERPRELRWYHAAGMLFGDWGTSRLYVLGLAYTMLKHEKTPHASFWYVAAMCVLVTLVGFSYTIICRHFPDGGGVYSASKQRSQSLAVIGALLLLADYIVTASLSAYDGFRYLLPLPRDMDDGLKKDIALYAAATALVLIGCLNIFGPRRVGTLALIVAVISGVFYFVIGAACVPHLHAAVIHAPAEPVSIQWQHFVGVILALSGVEAIANMTGVMAEPAAKNASKAILVVLLEVVVLNLVMAYAMNALPVEALHGPDGGYTVAGYQADDVKDHMLKILSTSYVGPAFTTIAAIFFGLLLLSAANTAIGGMVSIQYLMSRDKELPLFFTHLNKFGMPWVGLCTATLIPTLVLLFVGSDLDMLADLYAIGVVGAITINMLACGTNPELELKSWERTVLLIVGTSVAFIEASIAYDKPKALIFAMTVVSIGLTARYAAKREWPKMQVAGAGIALALVALLLLPYAHGAEITPKPVVSHLQSFTFTGLILAAIGVATLIKTPVPVSEPQISRSEIRRREASAIHKAIPANAPRLLVPTRGGVKLMHFAANYAKHMHAALFVLFVREVALAFRERGGSVAAESMTLSNDPEALKIFAEARKICDDMGVPMAQLYAVHDSAAELILDHAATLGVDAVIMGVSKRGALWKTLRGDVLQEVVGYLPDSIPLLIHA